MVTFKEPNPLAFTDDEAPLVQTLLDGLVLTLRHVPGGGKIEEGHWSFIYHSVRGADVPNWSNMPMRDYLHKGLGVEMKLKGEKNPLSLQGKSIMHPAATRTISFDPNQDAETCKNQVLLQFGSQISQFRERVRETSSGAIPEIRWGILLWSPKLTEFLYFEEHMTEPNPDDYEARFVENRRRSAVTRNLHIFEKETGVKRFSVTSPEKGAKVQPYFDVPHIGDGAFAFIVSKDPRKPLWLTEETFALIEAAAGTENPDEFLRRLLAT